MALSDKMEKSLEGVLVNALRHCSRFRLSQHDFADVTKEVRLGLASRMLDWLESEMAATGARVGGGTISRPSTPSDDADAHLRAATRSRRQSR